MQQFKEALPTANKFLQFVNASRSPWHAVDNMKKTLLSNGFSQLHEKDNWDNILKNKGKYFFTRNESCLIAFAIGGQYKAGNGFKIIGAHTDSPDLKIKPISKQEKNNYLQVGIATYGGGLWYTWFDRDLTVAGRAIVKTKDGFQHRLVTVDRPILRVPSLAIHLNREVNEKGFKPNTETNVVPILATNILQQIGKKEKSNEDKKENDESHHSELLNLLAQELKCEVSDIKDLELSIVDVQPAAIGGINEEFIFSPRLDNLLSCFCGLEALLDDSTLESDQDIRVVAMFDNEEVGSKSAQGAYSSIINDTFKRIISVTSSKDTSPDAYEASIHKSFLISADMAHAVHPNYHEKHQEKHRPMIHKGPVIKVNANQRYATTAVTSFFVKELAQKNNIPFQEFVVRNDMGCGSTIGPLLAGQAGIRTLDIGIPQLSMHSIREMCGTVDVLHTIKLFSAFFSDFRDLDSKVSID